MNVNFDEDQHAYKVHATFLDNDDEDSSDDNSDFDEFYKQNKPPPVTLDDFNVIKIDSFVTVSSKVKIKKTLYENISKKKEVEKSTKPKKYKKNGPKKDLHTNSSTSMNKKNNQKSKAINVTLDSKKTCPGVRKNLLSIQVPIPVVKEVPTEPLLYSEALRSSKPSTSRLEVKPKENKETKRKRKVKKKSQKENINSSTEIKKLQEAPKKAGKEKKKTQEQQKNIKVENKKIREDKNKTQEQQKNIRAENKKIRDEEKKIQKQQTKAQEENKKTLQNKKKSTKNNKKTMLKNPGLPIISIKKLMSLEPMHFASTSLLNLNRTTNFQMETKYSCLMSDKECSDEEVDDEYINLVNNSNDCSENKSNVLFKNSKEQFFETKIQQFNNGNVLYGVDAQTKPTVSRTTINTELNSKSSKLNGISLEVLGNIKEGGTSAFHTLKEISLNPRDELQDSTANFQGLGLNRNFRNWNTCNSIYCNLEFTELTNSVASMYNHMLMLPLGQKNLLTPTVESEFKVKNTLNYVGNIFNNSFENVIPNIYGVFNNLTKTTLNSNPNFTNQEKSSFDQPNRCFTNSMVCDPHDRFYWIEDVYDPMKVHFRYDYLSMIYKTVLVYTVLNVILSNIFLFIILLVLLCYLRFNE